MSGGFTEFYSHYYMHDKKLGEGGFSKVKLATHLLTGEKVAVKCMDKAKLGDDLFRVQTEIKALKKLSHPNIARLLQVLENEEKIYLVMEYCSGGELFDYIVAKSRLTEVESKGIMKSLIQCLQYIHSNGFAHRDLKPENVLFDKAHNIKLIDFGLAAHPGDGPASLQHLKTCCGSPAYAAPELISGEEYSGPAADVWSAGVILYALLVGQLPFDDDNLATLYKKIMAGEYKVPTWLSDDCKSILRSMLSVNASRRITIDGILTHPWLVGPEVSQAQKRLTEVMVPASDEVVLWEVRRYFPSLTISQLRHKVFGEFGSERATYWLLKEKLATRPSYPPPPVTSGKKQPQGTYIPLQCIKEEIVEDKAKVMGVKRKIFDEEENSLPECCQLDIVHATPPKKPLTEDYVTPPSKIPVPVRVLCSTPKNQTRNQKVPDAPQVHRTPLQKTEVNTTVKTPTPLKNKIDRNTPSTKKNIFKRFLASATPSANSGPRTMSETTTKNITMTKFQDAEECVSKLITSLEATGIECKKKGFLMQCSYSNKYQTVLTFTLEVCMFGDKCVIQRKRLRGDAWNYKKICEAILRFSNDALA